MKSGIFKYMQYSTIGLELGLSVTVGVLVGYWMDQKFGTEPWLTLTFLMCGIFAGFSFLYRMAKKYMKDSRNEENQGSN
jgi:ATP synthase protein I